ncbi:MAG: phosphoribosylformimino-5-aminoimidazole carboxamide ribotide isomerase [Verrucomicrobia bacterium]|nr:phosphoribosylformimino-5-aminoimidazole carboxamide ribotide isomerase [Verrucomicrobiota bacterium]
MFRPCIDLHNGQVKQIVGGSLSDSSDSLKTNFTSPHPAEYFAQLYKQDQLTGGHIIQLGPGNHVQALNALMAYPGGMQIGGGITPHNALEYLNHGASHVIVTSWIFQDNQLCLDRLKAIHDIVGADRLVIDLSCRLKDNHYFVVTNRWQTYTQSILSEDLFLQLAPYCNEFLVHAVDVEGLCLGVDLRLVQLLANSSPLTVTYAGGARSLDDLINVTHIGKNKIHLTIGSALDIFGGSGITYAQAIQFNRSLS